MKYIKYHIVISDADKVFDDDDFYYHAMMDSKATNQEILEYGEEIIDEYIEASGYTYELETKIDFKEISKEQFDKEIEENDNSYEDFTSYDDDTCDVPVGSLADAADVLADEEYAKEIEEAISSIK